MRVSILAFAFVLSTATLAAQGAPPGQRSPELGPGGPDDFGRNFFPAGARDAAPE